MRKLVLGLAVLVGVLVAGQAFGATIVDVYPGDDLDAKANAAPAGATIQVHGKAGVATYYYTIDNMIRLEDGQTLIGDVGATSTVGPAVVPSPVVGIKSSRSLNAHATSEGDNIRIAWLNLDATGNSKAVKGLDGGPNLVVDHVVARGAKGSCIGQYRGSVFDSNIFGCGTDPINYDGTVSAIKCNYACEVSRVYAHDNPGNGIWCDVGCKNAPNQPKGFWAHDNVAANNGRHGIFYENSPLPSQNPDEHVEALIEGNRVFGNDKSGISVSDASYGVVQNNRFGISLQGVINHNYRSIGIELHSSGDPTRGTQHDALIQNNVLNGEIIKGTGSDQDGTLNTGCGDNGNVCSGNF